MQTKQVILLKYGEIVLKGLNKSHFEQILVRDVKHKLAKLGSFSVSWMQSTIYIERISGATIDEALEAMKKVFGIVSLCKAYVVAKDMNEINAAMQLILPDLEGKTSFKVEAKRADKRFPLTSPQIAAEAGGMICELRPDLPVNVRTPDITVHVEIRDTAAYIHAGVLKGAGGMPLASSGRALLLLSGGIDSPVAGFMMAKRGTQLELLHFESYPYTSEKALQKVIDLAEIMAGYCGEMRLHTVSVKEIQEELRKSCDEQYFTLLLRRFMMRIASKVACRTGSHALITGESLGQVASQTLNAMCVTENAADIPVFRPLIAFDKEDIVKISRNIGTFDTSVLPYEDCCTVFTPRHPSTQPQIEKILEQEEKLNCDELTEKALETGKVYYIGRSKACIS